MNKETETPEIPFDGQPVSITQIMESAYIDYSMSVIVSRALPDARDGLKPVQRRILYAMLKEGLLSNKNFDKCAGVVGEVLKNFHPHGDASVYDTLVRLAQNWVMRVPLIAPQGNFGSIDGDRAAAYRYTECRLTPAAEDLLKNIDQETVEFIPNYKESTVEPSVLPSGFPNLLVNGSTGIAVGMATNIPPHNLGEIIDATCLIIDNPNCTIDNIIEVLPGPDFPTGGVIAGTKEIKKYMETGRESVRIRGVAEIQETKQGKQQIIITEIPYNVNRSNFVQKIAELIQQKTFTEISDLRDESDENTRIVIELKRNETPRVVLNKLGKHTAFENSFGVILLALDKCLPKQMNIKELLNCYIEHKREVIYRRIKFLLEKAQSRTHVLEGYKIALENLNDFVKIIRGTNNKETARIALQKKYTLTDKQADAILELRLYQLTGLEQEKIEDEYKALQEEIKGHKNILENEKVLLKLMKSELLETKKRFATPRLTQLIPEESEFRMEDVIPKEGTIITVSHQGFIKRTATSNYKSQKRGGKGVIGTGQHDQDFVEHLFTASTHDYIMFFMNNGRVYVEKVYNIPEGSRTGKGRSIVNLLALKGTEKIQAMICVEAFKEDTFIIMATKNGTVKRTNLKEYSNHRKTGIIGIKIDLDDELLGCKLSKDKDEVVLVTKERMSVRFKATDLRPQGRATRGVRGIKLKKANDQVQSIEIVDPEASLLIACENGMGKRTGYEAYRVQKRGGTGIIATKTNSHVIGALSVKENDEIMLLTHQGQAVRSPIKGIRSKGRATQGVKLINLSNKGKDPDKLVGICKVIEVDDLDIN